MDIPGIVYEAIYLQNLFSKSIGNSNLKKDFELTLKNSESIKKKLNDTLGPYLANPYYGSTLNQIQNEEIDRSQKISADINTKQLALIENEEKNAIEFCKKIINNFEVLVTLFDNFIFEEDFIILGDEEYFKERKDYNFLCKLKTENKGNINLDSKRAFKKFYSGIDKNLIKVNLFEKFNHLTQNLLQNNEEKIKLLESESKKPNFSKSLTGLKLLNNKNLYKNRNNYYEFYCKKMKENIDDFLKYFDDLRQIEVKYSQRWNEIIQTLKTANK
jgi:hypothetical protein